MLSSKVLGPTLVRLEGVAYAPDGAYVGWLTFPVELLPQVRDVVLDHARRDLARNAPHGVEQHGAREDPPRALHQGRQECELLGGELHPLVPPPDLVAHRVECHVPDPDRRRLRGRSPWPPGQRPYP